MTTRRPASPWTLLALLLLLLLPVSYHLATTDPVESPAPDQPEDAVPVPAEAGEAEATDKSVRVAPLPGGETGGTATPAKSKAPLNAPPGYFPEFHGRVVDLVTREPIRGARILYGPLPNWTGADSRADGTFEYRFRDPPRHPSAPFRVRISAPGYETLELTPAEAELAVELRPDGQPTFPGRIRGQAVDKDGQAVSGILGVVLARDGVRLHWLAVQVDSKGEFLLDGVEPGRWGISLSKGPLVEVYVSSDREEHVTLRAGYTRDEIGERPANLEKIREKIVELRAELERVPRGNEPLRRFLLDRLRVLETQAAGLELEKKPARREIRITGLAGHDGKILVAEFYGSSTERWRATIRDGAARFPALFPAKWGLKILDPTGETRSATLTIPEGDGADFPFPAR